MAEHIDWPRYWFDQSESPGGPNLVDGFLPDPETSLWAKYNPGLYRLDDLRLEAALGLLGEPGSGKSTELRSCIERSRGQRSNSLQPVEVYCALGRFSSFEDMSLWLEREPAVRAWRSGGEAPEIFWDGLDEAPFPNAPAQISRWLHEHADEKLKVRVACRSLAWSATLEQALALHARKSGHRSRVLRLAPLREEDVALIAGEASDQFLKQVRQLGLGPLASSPALLIPLLTASSQGAPLPNGRFEALELSVRLACEWRRVIDTFSLRPRLDAARIRQIASRIAALCILCERPRIRVRGDESNGEEKDLLSSQILGTSLSASWLDDIRCDPDELDQVLDTPLFISPSPGTREFIHRTTAEFLAAEYLAAASWEFKQLRSILMEPRSGKVIPQLKVTVSLLATQNRDLLAYVADHEPQVLLAGDVSRCSEADRCLVVERLLDAVSKRTASHSEIFVDFRGRDFRSLNFAGIEGVIGPVLADRSAALDARWLAIEIAEGCNLTKLFPDLVRIALASDEASLLRSQSAWVIARSEDHASRSELAPLIELSAEEDPDDELKGCALLATWPDQIDPKHAFRFLAPPRKQMFFGSYRHFLDNDFVEKLPVRLIAEAVTWTSGNLSSHDDDFLAVGLLSKLLQIALTHLDDPEVFASAVQVLRRSQRHHARLNLPPVSDEDKLRLLEALLSDSDSSGILWLLYDSGLIPSRDFAWTFGRGQNQANPNRRGYLELAKWLYYEDEASNRKLLLTAAKADETIRHVFAQALEFADPNSAASREREEYRLREAERKLELAKREEERRRNEEARIKAIETNLLACESDSSHYWRADLAIISDPTLSGFSELTVRLSSSRWWAEASEEARAWLVGAARKYLVSEQDREGEWFGSTTVYRPATAAFRAIVLLTEVGEVLGSEAYGNWLPIIVGFPTFGNSDDAKIHTRIICDTYRFHPEAVLDWLGRYIDKYDGQSGQILDVGRFSGIIDSRVAELLTSKATGSTPQTTGEILGLLV